MPLARAKRASWQRDVGSCHETARKYVRRYAGRQPADLIMIDDRSIFLPSLYICVYVNLRIEEQKLGLGGRTPEGIPGRTPDRIADRKNAK